MKTIITIIILLISITLNAQSCNDYDGDSNTIGQLDAYGNCISYVIENCPYSRLINDDTPNGTVISGIYSGITLNITGYVDDFYGGYVILLGSDYVELSVGTWIKSDVDFIGEIHNCELIY